MGVPTIRDLLEAGVHFGHQTRKWNPLMKKYIFAERNGIYIIDLQKTVKNATITYEAIRKIVSGGKHILFVGTKRQAQEAIKTQAERCGMFYIAERWLGGTLTNFNTIQMSIKKMKDIEKMKEDGTIEKLPKKEVMQLDHRYKKLSKILDGIRDMTTLPGALFVVDIKKENIAVAEARKLGIPVFAMVDTNCNPNDVDYVIPSNDDAIRAIRLFAEMIADAVLDGKNEFAKYQADQKEKEEIERKKKLEERAKKVDFVEEVIMTDEGGTKKKGKIRKRPKRNQNDDSKQMTKEKRRKRRDRDRKNTTRREK